MAEVSSGDTWSPLLQSLQTLRAEWPRRGWSWDSRLACVSSSFDSELDATLRPLAAKFFSSEWLPSRIAAAPQEVRDVAERTGGLRSGQLLVTSPPSGRAFAFGLWWPWGDGMTTSFRIGFGGREPREETFVKFREIFSVQL
jgi:hypothetical protein